LGPKASVRYAVRRRAASSKNWSMPLLDIPPRVEINVTEGGPALAPLLIIARR
jgi:hypothetical protein